MAVMSWIRGDEAVTKEWGPLGYVQLENGERWLVEVEEDSVGPNKARDGSDIPVKVIRTLLLANGEVVYGCADCFYVARRIESAVPHRNAHSTKERKSRKGAKSREARTLADIDAENTADVAEGEVAFEHPVGTPASKMLNGSPAGDAGDDLAASMRAVETLLNRARSVEELAKDRDHWKARALTAEERLGVQTAGLDALRKAMQGVMPS